MATYKFCTTLAAGCYQSADAPIISRHRTLEAAISKAKKNDRLAVYALAPIGGYQTGDCLFVLPPQGDPRLGHGRYGNGARAQ